MAIRTESAFGAEQIWITDDIDGQTLELQVESDGQGWAFAECTNCPGCANIHLSDLDLRGLKRWLNEHIPD